MDPATGSEIAVDFSPFLRVYKGGRVERLMATEVVPAGADPKTGVRSKDVVVSPETGVSARIYIPDGEDSGAGESYGAGDRRLPVVVYFHGGGFVIGSAAHPGYHHHLNKLVAGARVAAVSVEYRRAPEHPLPAAYDDSWAALKWVAAHSAGDGPDPWLNGRVDPTRIFLAGDSAGANIAHRMAVRSGKEDLGRVKGVVLVHPYFSETGGLLWRFVCHDTVGSDDPWINPGKDPDLGKMGCEKVLVCVAGLDGLCQVGKRYCDLLKEVGWAGSVEVFESEGQGHVFHLAGKAAAPEPTAALHDKIISFINRD